MTILRCPLVFKSQSCGYHGPVQACDKTFEDCAVKQHEEHYGGRPLLPGETETDRVPLAVKIAKRAVAAAFKGSKDVSALGMTRDYLESVVLAAVRAHEAARPRDAGEFYDGDGEED